MNCDFTWGNGTALLCFEYGDDSPVSVVSIIVPGVNLLFTHRFPIVEILTSDQGHWLASDRLVHTSIAEGLRYSTHYSEMSAGISRLHIIMRNPVQGIQTKTTYELPNNGTMCRVYTEVFNTSSRILHLESVTSWVSPFGAPLGQSTDVDAWELLECANDWLGEGRWHKTPCARLFPGLHEDLTDHTPRGEHAVVSTGTWSTGKHSPIAALSSECFGITWIFQVEHNGSWRWEVGNDTDDGYIALSGPTSVNHAWAKNLSFGETFVTVPASFGVSPSFDEAVGMLTGYRRSKREYCSVDSKPLVLFNDYMNTLNGDPTTDKLLPLIAAAAKVGSEVFCIDSGWYDNTGDWWSSVGEWVSSPKRFPHGIKEVVNSIKCNNMIPGLWLEPEVVGEESPVAKSLPKSAFFQRNGIRVKEQQRYILDFRDSTVIQHMNSVIDRLINDYGIGYFKFDYNISPGSGTDFAADSSGDGLLGHNRAYCRWIDEIHKKYPDLILENCSSGGMRMDFAQTSRFQVQSTSDQQDYRLYPTIASAAGMHMLPEQAANWAYPQATMTDEECAFNLNTTILGRFFLSGYVNRMTQQQQQIISQAIRIYKEQIRPEITDSIPFWPLGLPEWNDSLVAYGLRAKNRCYVTVWARNTHLKDVTLTFPEFKGCHAKAIQLFPIGEEFAVWSSFWDKESGTLLINVPQNEFASRTFTVVASDRVGEFAQISERKLAKAGS